MWEVQSIIKGYRCRSHDTWESARMASYWIMSSMADLKSAGIHSDRDLIKFPWEKDRDPVKQPTNEEIEQLREMMRRENAEIEKRGT